jgi:sulfotransferase
MKLHFIGGLPRSGSTLLTSLLYQNKLIHTEGISALCDLMWVSSRSLDSQAVHANRRTEHAKGMVSSLPSLYYSEIDRPIVIDKCRRWTVPENVNMLLEYVTSNPKIICCVRDLGDIVQSFKRICSANKVDFDTSGLVEIMNGDIYATHCARKANNPNMYHFVEYESLCTEPQKTLDSVYDFLELERFKHDFNNIVNQNQEDDSVYGLEGMHDVRSSICHIHVGSYSSQR